MAANLRWCRFWMRFAGPTYLGRIATQIASLFAPPHKRAAALARMSQYGYVTPSAVLYHPLLTIGSNVYIGDRVLIFQAGGGGPITIGDRVCILRDTIIETGDQGSLHISDDVYIHPRCQINTYKVAVKIGHGVLLAANCALYSHEHGIALNRPIREQPLYSKGPIIVGDHAWLGTGVVVLGGVTIGEGAVVGAGAVVTKDIPDNCIALGVPAKVVGKREPERDNFHTDSESAKLLGYPSGSKRKVMT